MINPIQVAGEMGCAKRLPISFSLVTSTIVRISLQEFLLFSFNLSTTLVLNFLAIPVFSPKLLNLNQDYPSEMLGFFGEIFINLRL